MKKIPYEAIFFIIILLFFPLEHKYDRPFRPFFYKLPSISKETAKALYIYLTDLLILIFAVQFLVKKRARIRDFFFQENAKFLFAITCFAFLSLFLCKTPITVLHWWKASFFFISFLFYCSIRSLFRNHSPTGFFQLLFWSIVFLSLFESFVGIYQYFQQKALGIHLLGEPKLNSTSFSRCTLVMKEQSFCLLDFLIKSPLQKNFHLMRAYGTFPHPNVFGGFMTFAIFCTYALIRVAKSPKKMILFSLILLLQVFTLFITFSRSALYAWVLGSTIWFICLIFSRKEQKIKNKNIFTMAFLPLICFLTCLCFFYPQIKTRGGVVSYTSVSKDSDSERLSAQSQALKVIQKYPLAGVGYANYEDAVRTLFKEPFYMIHNIYFLFASEMGLIAFAIFLFFIFRSIRAGWEKRSDPFYSSILAAFIGFLFIGICDYYPLFFQQGRLLFIALAAFLSLEDKKLLNLGFIDKQPNLDPA